MFIFGRKQWALQKLKSIIPTEGIQIRPSYQKEIFGNQIILNYGFRERQPTGQVYFDCSIHVDEWNTMQKLRFCGYWMQCQKQILRKVYPLNYNYNWQGCFDSPLQLTTFNYVIIKSAMIQLCAGYTWILNT